MTSLERFVLEHLPRAPSRVLEIGCGAGKLALRLSAAGYDIVAIDPEAPEGEIFRRVRLEDFEGAQPFDAVVASGSLHHIKDLPAAVERIAGVLRPGGLLLLSEHAREEDHAGLHGYAAIRRELDRRFAERHVGRSPELEPTVLRYVGQRL